MSNHETSLRRCTVWPLSRRIGAFDSLTLLCTCVTCPFPGCGWGRRRTVPLRAIRGAEPALAEALVPLHAHLRVREPRQVRPSLRDARDALVELRGVHRDDVPFIPCERICDAAPRADDDALDTRFESPRGCDVLGRVRVVRVACAREVWARGELWRSPRRAASNQSDGKNGRTGELYPWSERRTAQTV